MSLGAHFYDFVATLGFRADLPPLDVHLPEALDFQARTHASLHGDAARAFEGAEATHDYRKLALVGDAVIALATIKTSGELYPLLTNGATTTIKAGVVSNQTLAAVCRAYGLEKNLRAQTGKLAMHQKSELVQAALFEALVGAFDTQAGHDVAYNFAKAVVTPLIARAYDDSRLTYAADDDDDDHVSTLELWKKQKGIHGRAVKYHGGPPSGEANVNQLEVPRSLEVTVNGNSFVVGPITRLPGQRDKAVKQQLARAALARLGLLV